MFYLNAGLNYYVFPGKLEYVSCLFHYIIVFLSIIVYPKQYHSSWGACTCW